MSNTIRLLVLLAMVPLTFEVSEGGADSLLYHQEKILIREFNDAQFDQYRSQRDFQYLQESPRSQNGIMAFIRRMLANLFDLINTTADSPLGSGLFYLMGAACLLYLILRMLGMDFKQILGRPASSMDSSLIPATENIHELNFQDLIQQSISDREYRTAVRWWYLYSLKILTDQHHINWEPAKTNAEYLAEMKNSPLAPKFKDLSFYFEYIWYGNFGVSETLFDRVQALFKAFNDNLKTLK